MILICFRNLLKFIVFKSVVRIKALSFLYSNCYFWPFDRIESFGDYVFDLYGKVPPSESLLKLKVMLIPELPVHVMDLSFEELMVTAVFDSLEQKQSLEQFHFLFLQILGWDTLFVLVSIFIWLLTDFGWIERQHWPCERFELMIEVKVSVKVVKEVFEVLFDLTYSFRLLFTRIYKLLELLWIQIEFLYFNGHLNWLFI